MGGVQAFPASPEHKDTSKGLGASIYVKHVSCRVSFPQNKDVNIINEIQTTKKLLLSSDGEIRMCVCICVYVYISQQLLDLYIKICECEESLRLQKQKVMVTGLGALYYLLASSLLHTSTDRVELFRRNGTWFSLLIKTWRLFLT